MDTNCIMEAWVRHYPRDIFIGLWRDFEALIDHGLLISPEAVKEELERKEDQLANWAKQRAGFFVPFDKEQEQFLIEILRDHELLMKDTKHKNAADPFVIALAQAKGLVVVTQEQYGGARKPKIPDVCDLIGVDHIQLLELIRREAWQY